MECLGSEVEAVQAEVPTREPRKSSSSKQNFYHFRNSRGGSVLILDVLQRWKLGEAPLLLLHPSVSLSVMEGLGVRGASRTLSVCEDKWQPLLSSAARPLQVALLAVPPPSASPRSSSFVLRPPPAPLSTIVWRRSCVKCKSQDSLFSPPSASEGLSVL